MKNWKVEQSEVKIHRDIFQEDVLLPLLFVIAMIPLNHNLRKCTSEYKLSKSQEKTNHLMFMDGIKLFAKNKKRIENSNTGSENIQSGRRKKAGLEKFVNLKWEAENDTWQKE